LRARDKSLRPLFTLRKLERFYAALWWDVGERTRLWELNPGIRTD
jgi:hypothetical protein